RRDACPRRFFLGGVTVSSCVNATEKPARNISPNRCRSYSRGSPKASAVGRTIAGSAKQEAAEIPCLQRPPVVGMAAVRLAQVRFPQLAQVRLAQVRLRQFRDSESNPRPPRLVNNSPG